MIAMTFHAMEQTAVRGRVAGFQASDVVFQCERRQLEILKLRGKVQEVRVIVKRLSCKVSLSDGSNGDVVIACVDPRNLKVKTVMLQRSSQVETQIAKGEIYL